MKYLLALIGPDYDPDDVPVEVMRDQILPQWVAFEAELKAAGAYIAGEALEMSGNTTTVRMDAAGDHMVTDGPYAETKEKLGGFYLIEAASREEAIAFARKVPMPEGAVEVRAIVDFAELID